MASPVGTPSGSSLQQKSASEEDLQAVMKRKRSNRESARRSRMRKQKHLDGLTAQIGQLRKENSQMVELRNRLQSLNDILHCLKAKFSIGSGPMINDNFINPWNLMRMNQPIMASAENMFQY
ncbi:ocs element-binding factor 1 [Musa troglodytarum]|uniref:Ocs element-binding factor 1 n=1 Tax=Musa troglodytarum TaxID=320322 RepID=A0A9E7JBK1_9LILI|nr:ocs element-binding factor 1 [Musa troglodytarum]